MIVVADTSPINYLVQIACDSLLPSLYQRALIPEAVLHELDHPSSPGSVKSWLLSLPTWIDIRRTSSSSDPALDALDPGERDAILLAKEEHADVLLIDERRGRLEAQRRGLATTGTLGVLLAAHEKGLMNAHAAYTRLINETSFRTTPELDRHFLQRIRK